MVIKTLAWKVPKPGKLLSYIRTGALSAAEGGFTLFHNATYPSLRGIGEDFDQLMEKTKTNRYIKNFLNHHILAFSPKDNEKLSGDVLQQLTEKYLQTSGLDRTTVFAEVHRGPNNGFHVHVMTANVPVGLSNKSLRISKAKYKQLRLEMETFQLEHFDLRNSVVHLDKVQTNQRDIQQEDQYRRRENKYQARTRSSKALRKDYVVNTLTDLHNNAIHLEDFIDSIQQSDDLTVYQRGGRPYGVTYLDKN